MAIPKVDYDPNALAKALLNFEYKAAPVASLAPYAPGGSPKPFRPTGLSNKKKDKGDNRSIFNKSMDWLLSGMQGVENVVMDVTEGVKGEEGFGNTLGDIGRDIAAAGTGIVQPIINAGPIKTPWENAVSDFTMNYKTKHEGGDHISGSKLLDEWLGPLDKDANLATRIMHGGLGLGLDIGLDPTTYFTLLTSAIPKIGAKVIGTTPDVLKAAKAGKKAGYVGPYQARADAAVAHDLGKTIAQEAVPYHGVGLSDEAISDLLDKTIKPTLDEFGPAVEKLTPENRTKLEKMMDDEVAPVRLAKGEREAMLSKNVADLEESLGKSFDNATEESISKLTPADVPRQFNPENTPFMAWVEDRLLTKLGKSDAPRNNWDAPVAAGQAGRQKLTIFTKDGALNPLIVEHYAEQARPALEAGIPAKQAIPKRVDYGQATGHVAKRAVLEAQKIAAGTNTIGPEMQAKIFGKMNDVVGNATDTARAAVQGADGFDAHTIGVIQAMKSVEEALIAQGKQFIDHEGNALRFSDVIERLDPARLSAHAKKGSKSVPLDHILHALKGKSNSLDKMLANKDQGQAFADHLIDALAQAKGVDSAEKVYATEQVLDELAATYPHMEPFLTPAGIETWLDEISQRVSSKAKLRGFTDDEADELAKMMREYFPQDELATAGSHLLVETAGTQLAKQLITGEKSLKKAGFTKEGLENARLRLRISRSINRTFGLKDGAQMKVADILNKTEHIWARHLTTHYGRGFMKPKEQTETALARYQAHTRAVHFSKIFKGMTKQDVQDALMLIRKPWIDSNATAIERIPEIALNQEPRIVALADHLEAYMSQMYGAGLKTLKTRGRSVAAHNMATAQDINKHLKSLGVKWQFTTGEVKGGTWMDSWRNINFAEIDEDPVAFFYNLDLAMQRTQAEYTLVDTFASMMGRKAGDVGFRDTEHTTPVPHFRIDPGLKFDKRVANEFQQLLADFEKGGWRPKSEVTSFMTTALRKWKSGTTIYWPAHHIRNVIGDSWLMWAAGINDPRVFDKAHKIMRSQRAAYRDIIKGDDHLALENLLAGKGVKAAGSEDVIVDKLGSNITSGEIYTLARDHGGLLQDSMMIEAFEGAEQEVGSSFFKRLEETRLGSPLKGKGREFASGASEYREHSLRLAHLVGILEKKTDPALLRKLAKTTDPIERSRILKPEIERAAQEIRTYHPDGSDLTHFEQQYLRNIIPFYAWMRKAIPLLLEAMIIKPGKVTAYSKATFNAQIAMGIEAPGMTDPFPADKVYPDWITAQGIGPIGDAESDNPYARFFGKLGRNLITPFGGERGTTVINPASGALPTSIISDIFGQSGSPDDLRRGITDMLNPIARVGSELATDTQVNGTPINGPGGDGFLSYMASQTPFVSKGQSLTGLGKSPQEGAEGYHFPDESLLNLITAASIQGTGKYTKSAEFQEKERQKKLAEQMKKAMGG